MISIIWETFKLTFYIFYWILCGLQIIKIDKTNSLLCIYYNIIFSTHEGRIEIKKKRIMWKNAGHKSQYKYQKKICSSFIRDFQWKRGSNKKYVIWINVYSISVIYVFYFTFIVDFLLCRYLLLDIKEPTVKSSNNDAWYPNVL